MAAAPGSTSGSKLPQLLVSVLLLWERRHHLDAWARVIALATAARRQPGSAAC